MCRLFFSRGKKNLCVADKKTEMLDEVQTGLAQKIVRAQPLVLYDLAHIIVSYLLVSLGTVVRRETKDVFVDKFGLVTGREWAKNRRTILYDIQLCTGLEVSLAGLVCVTRKLKAVDESLRRCGPRLCLLGHTNATYVLSTALDEREFCFWMRETAKGE